MTTRVVMFVALASIASPIAIFADELAVTNDSSQTADLSNDRNDRVIISDQSQEPDLGNDKADWATITDESQQDDLE